MIASKLINIFGLIFDIAGATTMFFYTPHPTSGAWISDGEDLKNDLARERKEKGRVKVGMAPTGPGILLSNHSHCGQLTK